MGLSNLPKMKTYFHDTDYSLASVLTKNPLWHKYIYIYINFKKGSKALSKIEPKTEIEANFDESFTHFKLTLWYTTSSSIKTQMLKQRSTICILPRCRKRIVQKPLVQL